jgi:hypothetical protein
VGIATGFVLTGVTGNSAFMWGLGLIADGLTRRRLA